MTLELKPFSWQRMIEAVEAVRERALRATAALKMAGIPYALAGDYAVAAWVARVDKAAVRNTRDIDILGILTNSATTQFSDSVGHDNSRFDRKVG